MKKINILWLFFALVLLVSCETEGIDATSPQILEGNIRPIPISGVVCTQTISNVIYAKSGDSIMFGLTFRDEVLLGKYTISIHDNFDCHPHRGNVENWSFDTTIILTGIEYHNQEVIHVPSNVTAGNYHCSFSLVDAAGNAADKVYYTLSILNSADTIAPNLNLASPTANGTYLDNDDTLHVLGTLSDNAILNGGRLDLSYTSSSGYWYNAIMVNLDTTVQTNSYQFSIDYIIPHGLLNGAYDFELKGFDAVGNAATKADFRVQVQ